MKKKKRRLLWVVPLPGGGKAKAEEPATPGKPEVKEPEKN
jgi:hypothetical protein